MKILVCTDGSEQSQKAADKAAIIADGCNVHDLAILYVYDEKWDFSSLPRGESDEITKKDMEHFFKMQEDHKEKEKKILSDALKTFENKNIPARTIFKEGHPSHTIVKVACDEDFDMIVLGSRGRSGFKKAFLGSVSSAVVQEATNCSVLTVK